MDKNFHGSDASLVIDSEKYPCTSKSFSWEPQTSDSQFDDSPIEQTDKGVTGVDISGSFEYDGKNAELRDALMAAPENKHRLIIREDGGGVRCNGVIITSFSRDYPSDEKASTSIDYEAESATTF
ncbi:hypothetical protein J2752_000454 [Halarchaeum rubridurum]|uniref:Uncharacterized protein n=1 Tax=Halarchaeum rubridurum TaxID=489911 RepID=A0A830FYU6_9EURY|nr:hypothetical protein [Halarchaeum rubridurum]MBP1953573.1 hypothetical protein [Halarchaeum rubridurum]GGM64276.1 hypothetical protein GCM10009017_12880 [Halarchaeum rubridurum]